VLACAAAAKSAAIRHEGPIVIEGIEDNFERMLKLLEERKCLVCYGYATVLTVYGAQEINVASVMDEIAIHSKRVHSDQG
jgi:hypothetical protein